MRKPRGRLSAGRPLFVTLLAPALSSAAYVGCSSGSTVDANPSSLPGAAPGLGRARDALVVSPGASSVSIAPAAVGFELALDGERFNLSLQRAPAPTASGYQAFRRTRDGALLPLAPAEAGCTYRGVTESASSALRGFASMNVCSSATGYAAGDATSGIILAGGRFWRLWPDPADRDPSDGVDHFAQPLHRGDAASAPEPVRHTTLARVPASAAPELAFREGTDAETKYLDLVMVNDAARVAALGQRTEATTIQFVDTMNALLEGSGLSPRLRVTLRAQVLFDEDPYTPMQVGDEVDNDSLLNLFLAWAQSEQQLPVHDEHVLLSGLDFVGGVVGYAGLEVACTTNANGAIVQAGDADGGFAVLSAVHELGHTVGMNHDDGSQQGCPQQGFIMAAVGCGNCPGAEEATFSRCSIAQFQAFLAGPSYSGARCADDVPSGAAPSCGDGAVEEGETCDCGASDCSTIDPCCNGATCQLADGAECSDYNDGCCQACAVVSAEAQVVCRAQRSECDIAEVCAGSKDCPADAFEPAGEECQDERDNRGLCYFGDCRSRGTQCEQIDAQQASAAFDGIGEPGAGCDLDCQTVVCSNGPSGCLYIQGPSVNDGVACGDGGQCVSGQCVTTIDQCPADPNKTDPGDCGCGRPDADSDGDDSADCIDACPQDPNKQTPGDCGCGQPERDSDGDGSPDCVDECPADAQKREAGDCGCGLPEIDSDGDGVSDCADECPDNAFFSRAGACGCGQTEIDTDFDGSPDCVDGCPADATHTTPPCAAASGADNAAFERSSDGGCALSGPAAPSASGLGHISTIGWLALALAPVLRRRRR